MTIIEQGRLWEVREAMRMTMREQHGERDELWRLENNNQNWMLLPAHTCRSLTSQGMLGTSIERHSRDSDLVLLIELLKKKKKDIEFP